MSREQFFLAADRAARSAREAKERALERPSGYAELSPQEIVCPGCNQVVRQGPDPDADEEERGYRSYPRYAHYEHCACIRSAGEQARKAFVEREWPRWAAAEWKSSLVPPRFREASFATFQSRPGTEAALRACREYAKNFEPGVTTSGLYLFGPFGGGKTHLAVATAREIVERTLISVTFKPVLSLLSEVKANFRRQRDDDEDDQYEEEQPRRRSDPVASAKGAEFLILDDLGQEYGTEFERSVIAEIICHRYDECLPTIYTSNLGDADLIKRLGGALVSRMWESTKGLQVGASDFRKEIARR